MQPLIKDSYEGFEGVTTYKAFPVIPNVPVVFQGGGGMRITFPIKAGDTVLLVFGDRSHDSWQDGIESVHRPADDHRHHLTDAYAIPGLHSNRKPWQDADTGVITLGSDSGASEFVATADRVLSELNKIKNTFNTHTHIAAGNATAVPTVPMLAPSSPASGTVKIKG